MARSAWCVVAAALLGLGVCSPATAGVPAWEPPTSAQLSAAVSAAHTPRAFSYAQTNLRRPGRPEPAGITVAETGIPAYTLAPAFVHNGTGPAALLQYVAVVARTADGRTSTIQAAPSVPGRPDSGWRVDSVLSGDDETQLTRQLAPGTVLLNEPQINGWYALDANGVRLLRASLPQNPVGTLVPLHDYQRQVYARYADKHPLKPTAATTIQTSSRPWWLVGALAVVAAVAAVWTVARRRRRHRPESLHRQAQPG